MNRRYTSLASRTPSRIGTMTFFSMTRFPLCSLTRVIGRAPFRW